MIRLGSRVRLLKQFRSDILQNLRIGIVYEISGTVNYAGEPSYYAVGDDGYCRGWLLDELEFIEQCSVEELLTHKHRVVRKIGLSACMIVKYCDQVSQPPLGDSHVNR